MSLSNWARGKRLGAVATVCFASQFLIGCECRRVTTPQPLVFRLTSSHVRIGTAQPISLASGGAEPAPVLHKAIRDAFETPAARPPLLLVEPTCSNHLLLRVLWELGQLDLKRAQVTCTEPGPAFEVLTFSEPLAAKNCNVGEACAGSFLTVAIAVDGFLVQQAGGPLFPSAGPTTDAKIPLSAGRLDFLALGAMLAKAKLEHPSDSDLILALDDSDTVEPLCQALPVASEFYRNIVLTGL